MKNTLKTTLSCFVLLALLFAPFAQAQTTPEPGAGQVASPSQPPEAAERRSAVSEPEQVAAKPPSILDFIGRMALVTVGAAVGEFALTYAGYALTRDLPFETAGVVIGIGANLGAGLGATLFGALVPGNNIGGTLGALTGSAVGLLVTYLLRYAAPLVFVAPAACAVLGYGIGYALGMPKASGTARHDGIRITPVVALASGSGGGQVGLAGSF